MQDLIENANVATLKSSISEDSLDQVFREARTYSAWLPEPVPLETTTLRPRCRRSMACTWWRYSGRFDGLRRGSRPTEAGRTRFSMSFATGTSRT